MAQHVNTRPLLCCILLIVICGCKHQSAEPPSNPDADLESGKTNISVDPDEGKSTIEAVPFVVDDDDNEVAAKYEDVPDGEPIIHRASAGKLQDDGWCIATSTRGNFQIEVPGKYVDLKDTIKELFKTDAEIALFYFAGHGHIEATGGYLKLHNTNFWI